MNYEELVTARNEGKLHKTVLPIGDYYREKVDGKWRGVVDIRPELHRLMAFTKAIARECEANRTLTNKHQIHFAPLMSGDEVTRLELEVGNFEPLEQLLKDDPAVVAEKSFADNVFAGLVDVTGFLHQRGIRHVCYSPRTVFVRKGDHSVMLLSHGSFYQDISDQRAFYGDDAQYVAPEVTDGGVCDDRADVYGIGRLMQAIFDQSEVPLEYRQVLKKATSEKPEDRFATPEDMLKALHKQRSTYRSVLTFVAALVIAAMCIFVYFELFPESEPVEFVKPAPRQPIDDLLDDGITLEELGLSAGDSILVDTMHSQRDYDAKAEEIFRKRYEQEAERIVSRIYNKEHMNNSEKRFMVESEEVVDELMKLQSEMAGESGLSHERAQVIASQIIERVTDKKKKEMGSTNSRSVKLPKKK